MADDLFLLIKSLDKNEKGYFKKFAARYGSKQGGNDYLKLFDLIDSQDSYNEEAVKKYFAKAGKKVNLSLQKSYLQQQIMQALRNYHSGSSAAMTTYEMLMNMEILHNKGLDNQLNKEIKQAKKVTRTDKFALREMMVNRYWQKQINRRANIIDKELAEYCEEEELLFRDVQSSFYCFKLQYQLADYYHKYCELPVHEIAEHTKDFLKHPLFGQVETLNIRQRCTVYNILNLYYSLMQDKVNAQYYLELRIATLEEMFPDMNNCDMDIVITYYNMIVSCLEQNNYAKADMYMQKLENLNLQKPSQNHYCQETLVRATLNYLSRTIDNTTDTMAIYQAEQKYHQLGVSPKYDTMVNNAIHLSYLFYLIKDYNRSLYWCDSLNDELEKSVDGATVDVLLQKAIVHYETCEVSLLESTIHNFLYLTRIYPEKYIHHRYLFQQLGKLGTCHAAEKKLVVQQMLDYALNMDYDQHDDTGFNIQVWCRAQLRQQSYLDHISASRRQAQTA